MTRSIVLPIVLSGCVGLQPAQPPGRAALVALDTSTCVAADVLPGVPQLIDHLSQDSSPVAERTIMGLISGVSAISKGVACYLRAQAGVRTQDGSCIPPEAGRAAGPGEVLCGEAGRRDDVAVIRARAGCEGAGCRREARLAQLLVHAEQQGLVVLR